MTSVLYETYRNVAGWQDRSPPEPVSRCWPRHERRQRSLTVFSQNERTALD
jgi:hypothetical protein